MVLVLLSPASGEAGQLYFLKQDFRCCEKQKAILIGFLELSPKAPTHLRVLEAVSRIYPGNQIDL